MTEEHKEEVLSVAQQRSARKARKAELLAFSALELEELTEDEILAFSKNQLILLARFNDVRGTTGNSVPRLREKILARRWELLAEMQASTGNDSTPPDPSEISDPVVPKSPKNLPTTINHRAKPTMRLIPIHHRKGGI